MIPVPAREAPAPSPLERLASNQTDPARPPVPNEPLLAIDNIQGNSVAGFNKDFQTLLLLKIVDVPNFKRWLKSLIPFIATAAEVLAFNRLFKAIRSRLGLTQAEFGDLLGISQKTVSGWEIHGLPRRYTVVVKLLELEKKGKRRRR